MTIISFSKIKFIPVAELQLANEPYKLKKGAHANQD